MFSSRLREQRLKHNLTMKQLGVRVNLAASTISGYENGIRKPDISILYLFADTFDVSVDYLLGRTDISQPNHIAMIKTESDQLLTVSLEEMEYLKESLFVFRKYRQLTLKRH
ncbi:helix-turn-helix domain-containing protein [Alkalicoccobacillus gibsonii]|jgi:transcriptional regulator with XRE-family HTH domain|uniref:helix-turn-helix domain-containing protein n=1 Tax=Alkalicoccobacillus gibsonii TaxID=79881 RepID=UPI001931F8E6|nr:helix-turn-helix transcriptional regulator [Alkalicoccobacillus gibsonii]MBM0064386.1 helix-turn-helix transcriptional regulator [Alkalicoccobacillus gibsonii]